MRIHQPDILKCDICSKSNSDAEIFESIPVLSYRYRTTEYGTDTSKATVVLKKFDLCEKCLRDVAGLEFSNNFHTPGYSIIRTKNHQPEEIEISKDIKSSHD